VPISEKSENSVEISEQIEVGNAKNAVRNERTAQEGKKKRPITQT
jgi:hypothetical protein